ncbi:MAG: nicotinate (nicotinamide) nucleotide adenylyltransferase [Bdellovibrio sp.]|jgi:nicotinate-nucleotide adenylyltransferase
MRVGIFGGSFNPPHVGHLNAIQDVAKKTGLKKVHIIPASQNPLKMKTEGPTPEQRLEMVKLAFGDVGDIYKVDDQEIKRGGASYTIDTVMNMRKTTEAKDLFLVIGADNLEELSQWKDYQKILSETNLVVTSRPGWELPTTADDLPSFLQSMVEEFDFNFVELKTGRSIQFVRLKDVELSASELRKWIRISKNVDKFLPLSVENFIKQNKIYAPIGDRIPDYKKFTEFCANVLFSKKGIQVRAFDLRPMAAPSEFALISSGTSTRHASSLGENLIQAVKEEYNLYPLSIEGMDEGRWVLLDYGSLIVHLFYDFVRQEYSLEKLWKDGVDLALKDPDLDRSHT